MLYQYKCNFGANNNRTVSVNKEEGLFPDIRYEINLLKDEISIRNLSIDDFECVRWSTRYGNVPKVETEEKMVKFKPYHSYIIVLDFGDRMFQDFKLVNVKGPEYTTDVIIENVITYKKNFHIIQIFDRDDNRVDALTQMVGM